jgi:hypothetical protein
VKKLIEYLIANMILDFGGDLSIDMLREFLKGDESRDARALLNKVVEDGGVDDLCLTLADVLMDHIRNHIDENTVREQIKLYAES